MYNVSEEYKNAMKKSVQRSRITGTIGRTPFTDKNILKNSFLVTNQCSDNTEVKIGQVYVGELNVTLINMNLPRYSLKDRPIVPFFGLMLDNGNYEDVPLGVFNVSEAEWTASGVVIKAYDNMSKLDKPCTINSAIGLPYQLATMACEYCQVELGTDEFEFTNFANGSEIMSMFTDNDIETWRDFLSWVAQSVGCNAMCDREGKIIFKAYNQNVIDVIDSYHRLAGASFSDFITKYTGLSCVNIAEKTTSYYGMEVDDGLTYNLGSNPFLQYGVDAALAATRRNILDALQQINYVPFKAEMIGDPAYDLMDVFQFPEGIGDGEKLFCMTKYTFNFHGKYEMQGVGKNPALASAKSKTDKELAGLMSDTADEAIHYTVFTNANDIVVADGENKSIMFIRFVVQKTTHAVIDMEILLTAETTEEGEEFAWVEHDAVAKVTYYLNDEEITTYHPIETYQDGRHVLRLRYDLQAVAAQIHTWEVWLEMNGGKISIDKYNMYGVIAGTGLAGDSEWDGNIRAQDDIRRIRFYPMIRKIAEELKTDLAKPHSAKPSDRFRRLNFAKMFRGIKDTLGATSEVMTFTPWVNSQWVETGCTFNANVGWVGDGTTALGTALAVTTVQLTGVKRIETKSSNAIYYASFDDGETWVGWTADGWVEGASMIKDKLEAVPETAWALNGGVVRIRAVLETDASLFTLDVYGGKIYNA